MKNITMIGAPSSGKSTVGILLAKRLGMGFTDLDILIQQRTGKLLKEIISQQGIEAFLNIEEMTACSLDVKNSIIAPGGSICYGAKAMRHLKEISTVIYLYISYDEMLKRIGDVTDRGVIIPKGYTLKDLYDERAELYEKYADITIDETGKDAGLVVDEIRALMNATFCDTAIK